MKRNLFLLLFAFLRTLDAQAIVDSLKKNVISEELQRHANARINTVNYHRRLQIDTPVKCEEPINDNQSSKKELTAHSDNKTGNLVENKDSKKDMEMGEFLKISQDINNSFHNDKELMYQKIRLQVTMEKEETFKNAIDAVRVFNRS